jgi:uncharacterized protein YuzE
MKISYDDEADALYVKLTDSEVATSHIVDEGRVLDVDEAGEPVGIEVLGVSEGVFLADMVEKYPLRKFRDQLIQVEMRWSPADEA